MANDFGKTRLCFNGYVKDSVKVPTRRERMSGKRSAIYDLR